MIQTKVFKFENNEFVLKWTFHLPAKQASLLFVEQEFYPFKYKKTPKRFKGLKQVGRRATAYTYKDFFMIEIE